VAEVLKVVFREKLINCLSALRISSGANTIAWFVDHPQFSYRFLLFDAQLCEGLHFGVVRYQHVLKYSFAIHPDQTQLNDFLCLSTGTDGLDADPSTEPYELVVVGRLGLNDLA
jgi:hypothetical protein